VPKLQVRPHIVRVLHSAVLIHACSYSQPLDSPRRCSQGLLSLHFIAPVLLYFLLASSLQLQQPVLLLKMDTEGAEHSALQGLTDLLEARQVCLRNFETLVLQVLLNLT
jgi:hypothetical protein